MAERVREAVLKVEHVALKRRFKEFVCAHVSPSYFRSGFQKEDHPVGQSELPEVLGLAYDVRSQYVHQLKRLPDPISLGHGYYEAVFHGRTRLLTLQGLSRLMRHAFVEFVSRQPVTDKEPYACGHERAGVVQVRMAAQYWVGRSEGDIGSAGRVKLEGFLEQLASALLKEPDASITDMRDVLSRFAETAVSMKREHRYPYLAIHVLFNEVAGPSAAPTTNAVDALVASELEMQTPEALLVHAFFGQVPSWSLEDNRKALGAYRRQRGAKTGVRFPRVFEAAIALELADRYRAAEDFGSCNELVIEAADDFPDCDALPTVEQSLSSEVQLHWPVVLLRGEEPIAATAYGSQAAKGSTTGEKRERGSRVP